MFGSQRFPCVHAVATTPAQRLGVLFALLRPAISACDDAAGQRWNAVVPFGGPVRGYAG